MCCSVAIINRLSLLHLPEEILILIFGFLDRDALCNALTVSRHCQILAEPYLYHTVEILSGEQSIHLANSIAANERRATWVRSLLVSTTHEEADGLELLPPKIRLMRNLVNLRLETPDCNARAPEDRLSWIALQDRYERIFENASAVLPKNIEKTLPMLESCTIHFVDSEKELYLLTRYAMIFLHPRLRSLTVSCASTDFPYRLLAPFQKDPNLVQSTSLEHLHLEECDIYADSLAMLLRFPRALKSLKISEGVRYDGLFRNRSSRVHGNVPPEPLVEALKVAQDTLETLSLTLGYCRQGHQQISHLGQHLNLTSFSNIKHLELEIRTVNLVRVRQCDHMTWRRLPPNLETFRIFGIPLGARPPFQALARPYFPLETCFIQDKAKHGVAKLKELTYSYEYYGQDDDYSDLSILDGDTEEDISPVSVAKSRIVAACNGFRRLFHKAGLRLIIEMVILPNGFIPPYLYLEQSPQHSILWDSTGEPSSDTGKGVDARQDAFTTSMSMQYRGGFLTDLEHTATLTAPVVRFGHG